MDHHLGAGGSSMAPTPQGNSEAKSEILHYEINSFVLKMRAAMHFASLICVLLRLSWGF